MNTCADCCCFDSNKNLCRKNPPVIVVELQGGFTTYTSMWPVCSPDDWCHAFVQKSLEGLK